MPEKDWYDNKELFEMIQDLKLQLAETTKLIKEYNGLRAKQTDFEYKQHNFEQKVLELEGNFDKKINNLSYEVGEIKNDIKEERQKDKEIKKDWQWVLGWAVAVGSLLIAVFK